MPSIKELFRQRKAAKEPVKGRVSIVWVLIALGFFLIFAVLSIISTSNMFRPILPITLGITGGTFMIYLLLAIKYKKNKTAEQETNKIRVKNTIGSLVFMILFLGLIIFGVSFFIWLVGNYPFSLAVTAEKGRLVGITVIAVIVYFASAPFLMALWYKTSPGMAVRLIVRIFKAFNWKMKDKACEVMVLHSVQDHSVFMAIKRAFTALVYSMTLVFSFIRIIGPFLPSGFGREIVSPPLSSEFTELTFINYCSSMILVMVFPLVLSFVVFSWALPSGYLLDDAGVVYFKKYLKRRQPVELRSVSQWFLGIVQAIMGTSGLISYGWYVWDNREIIGLVYGNLVAVTGVPQWLAMLCAVQFALFIFGFPLLGTVLMVFILQLFQESQYNKLKTFLFQELVKAKIDPRVVHVKFERTGTLQDRTLLEYPGENFFRDPPLKDSTSKLPPAGDIPFEDMLRK